MRLALVVAASFLAADASALTFGDAAASARDAAKAAAFGGSGVCPIDYAPGTDFTLIADGPAPDFKLKDMEGADVTLSGLRGKVVLLDFWATWCPPCRASVPVLQKLHELHAAKGLVILGMNQRESAADIKAFMGEKAAHYRVTLDDGSASGAYKVRGLPTFVLVDRTGKEVWRGVGFAPATAAEMAAQIEKALAQ